MRALHGGKTQDCFTSLGLRASMTADFRDREARLFRGIKDTNRESLLSEVPFNRGISPHHDRLHGRTSKMSHDTVRRAACITTVHILWFHFETRSEASGVTDGGVGSGALLGQRRRRRRRLGLKGKLG